MEESTEQGTSLNPTRSIDIMTRTPMSRFENLAFRLFPWIFISSTTYRLTNQNIKRFLDVGCGTGNITRELTHAGPKFSDTYLVGADIWLPYLTEAKKIFHDTVRCDIRKLPFRPCSFDLVIATDVLEHLEKRDGGRFLDTIESAARKQIFLFTPVGYNVKRTLEDKNPWQVHRSGWSVSEFRNKGYQVYGMSGGRFLYKERCDYKVKFPAFWPFIIMIRLWSGILTFWLAEGAYQMLCVKNRKLEVRAPGRDFLGPP